MSDPKPHLTVFVATFALFVSNGPPLMWRFLWVSAEVGESERTVNPSPLAELVRIQPHPPYAVVTELA